MPYAVPATVLVTGAAGNLGRKIIAALAGAPWCRRIVGVDLRADPASFVPETAGKLALVVGNLADPAGDWRAGLIGVEAVIHLAADNPDVDATWRQAATSFDMTANIGLAAGAAGVRRLVFASSNHVMGGYKDQPLSATLKPGTLSTALPPAPGTKWHDGTRDQDSTAYATAKLMGERFCTALAARSAGALTAVSIRIGWAQPGDNRAATISHAGSVIGGMPAADTDETRRDLRWFRSMWLSNQDLATLFLAAVAADPAGWPAPGIVVNGMSANRDMDWDIEATRRLLGYRPSDDLFAALAG